jgi:prevent-host-death family protein
MEPAVITETSAVAFRQNLGEMFNRVQYRHDSILIKKDGKPVAALVDARLFERIRLMQARFDALCDRLAQDFANVPEAEGVAAIEAAASAVRKEMKAEAGIGPADASPKAGKARRPIKAAPIEKAAKARKTAA